MALKRLKSEGEKYPPPELSIVDRPGESSTRLRGVPEVICQPKIRLSRHVERNQNSKIIARQVSDKEALRYLAPVCLYPECPRSN